MTNELSIIIPYRGDGGQRDRLLEVVKEQYNQYYPNSEIVISNDGYKDNEPFSRAEAINNGVKQSKGDILIISDADVLIHKNYLDYCIQTINEKQFIIPYNFIYYLNKRQTANYLRNKQLTPYTYHHHTIKTSKGLENPGGIQIITKELFNEIGQYNLQFKGWGWEDREFAWRIFEKLGKIPVNCTGRMYHLWHVQALPSAVNERFYHNILKRQDLIK